MLESIGLSEKIQDDTLNFEPLITLTVGAFTRGNFAVTAENTHAVTYMLYVLKLTCTRIRAHVSIIATLASFPSVCTAP